MPFNGVNDISSFWIIVHVDPLFLVEVFQVSVTCFLGIKWKLPAVALLEIGASVLLLVPKLWEKETTGWTVSPKMYVAC